MDDNGHLGGSGRALIAICPPLDFFPECFTWRDLCLLLSYVRVNVTRMRRGSQGQNKAKARQIVTQEWHLGEVGLTCPFYRMHWPIRHCLHLITQALSTPKKPPQHHVQYTLTVKIIPAFPVLPLLHSTLIKFHQETATEISKACHLLLCINTTAGGDGDLQL